MRKVMLPCGVWIDGCMDKRLDRWKVCIEGWMEGWMLVCFDIGGNFHCRRVMVPTTTSRNGFFGTRPAPRSTAAAKAPPPLILRHYQGFIRVWPLRRVLSAHAGRDVPHPRALFTMGFAFSKTKCRSDAHFLAAGRLANGPDSGA